LENGCASDPISNTERRGRSVFRSACGSGGGIWSAVDYTPTLTPTSGAIVRGTWSSGIGFPAKSF